MNPWLAFFVGTPQRFLRTAVGVLLIASMIYPPILIGAVNNLVVAVAPLIPPLLSLLIMAWSFRLIFRGITGQGSGGGNRRRE